MFKRIFLLTIFLLISQCAYSNEIQIKITPKEKYTTCQNTPQTGDFIEFVATEDTDKFPKGTIVQGLLTDRVENGFGGRVGSFYIEQFKINNKKFIGTVYQKGNPHAIYFEYFDWLVSFPVKILFDSEASFIRGGEAFLKPNKDIFTLYLKD